MAVKKAKKAPRQIAVTPEGHCDVCGRKLPPRKGSGAGRRPKRHKECVILRARMAELIRVLDMVRWAPPVKKPGSNSVLGHAGDFRSSLHEMWGRMTVKSVKSATDSRNYYVAPGAGRKAKAKQ